MKLRDKIKISALLIAVGNLVHDVNGGDGPHSAAVADDVNAIVDLFSEEELVGLHDSIVKTLPALGE